MAKKEAFISSVDCLIKCFFIGIKMNNCETTADVYWDWIIKWMDNMKGAKSLY